MGKMSVSLDEQSWSWLEEQAADAESYVNALIHKDQQRKAAETELKRMLEEADASGISEATIEDIWAEAEAEYLARHG